MNYLLSTTYQNNNYSHIVKGLELQEIQSIFSPESITQFQDWEVFRGDLVADCEFNNKTFQIISTFHRITDLFTYLYGINTVNNQMKIITLNSISQPLSIDKSQELALKLIEKIQENKKVVTPKIIALVDSMKKDVDDFIIRFTWYISEDEKDLLHRRVHDMYVYIEQWNIDNIKKTMGQIIEKMEFLESNYVKLINSNNDLPLDQFNHELNAIINQNRLFRNHSLNQLSWGSTFDYIIFKITSYIRLWVDTVDDEFKDIERLSISFISFLSKVWWIALIVYFVSIFIIWELWKAQYTIPFVKYGIIWLWCVLVYRFKNARRYISLMICILVSTGAYFSYQAITVNFWL